MATLSVESLFVGSQITEFPFSDQTDGWFAIKLVEHSPNEMDCCKSILKLFIIRLYDYII